MLHVCYTSCTGSQVFSRYNSRCWLFKVLHGTLLSMFPEGICPFHRTSMFQVPSFKFYHCMGLRESMTFLWQPLPYKHSSLKPPFLNLCEGCKELGSPPLKVLAQGKVGVERYHREQLDFCFCIYCFLGFIVIFFYDLWFYKIVVSSPGSYFLR